MTVGVASGGRLVIASGRCAYGTATRGKNQRLLPPTEPASERPSGASTEVAAATRSDSGGFAMFTAIRRLDFLLTVVWRQQLGNLTGVYSASRRVVYP